MAFGKPKHGNGNAGNRTNYINLKNGVEGVYRIIPPYGSLVEAGKWAMFYSIHFGYKDSKGRLRPFQSCLVKNFNTKMIEVTDPALDRINTVTNAFNETRNRIASGNVQGQELESLKKREEACKGFFSQYNLDNKWYMNVVDLSGKVGVLKISHKMKAALDVEIKKLNAKGIDPVSVEQGRFFSFLKSGKGPNTIMQVQVYKEARVIDGEEVEKEVKHTATPELEAKVKESGADLGSMYPKLTFAQVDAIVHGDIDKNYSAIESIFNTTRTEQASPATTSATFTSSASAPTTVYGDDDDFEPESLEYTPEVIQPKVETAPAPTPTPAPAIQPKAETAQKTGFGAPKATTTKSVRDLSNEEFLKSMGM
jgi:hypothetical protein